MPNTDKPLKNVQPGPETTVKLLGVALREATTTGLLTDDGLNTISNRVQELLLALQAGKVIEVSLDRTVEIRDATEAEQAEMDNRPDEFPISKRSRKTLEI